MDILFVSSSDLRVNSSANIRNVSLIRCLKMSGHNVYVIMNVSNKQYDDNLVSILQQNSIISLKKIDFNNNTSQTNQSKKKKSILKSFFIRAVSRFIPYDISVLLNKKILKNAVFPKRIDCIISSSDPNSSHLLAKKIKEKYGKPIWIQYWGDVMAEDTQFRGKNRNSVRRAERKILNLADTIVYTNPIVCQYMSNIYPQFKERITWCPTPFSVHKYNIDDGADCIGYFGSYSTKNRDISKLLEAVVRLKKPMYLVGGGDVLVPKEINCIPRCSSEELIRFEEKCNIVVVLDNKYIKLRDNTYGCLQVPGKLYHYANSSFYILVICEGDLLKKYYSNYNRFVFCSNDVDDIYSSFTKIINGEYQYTLHTVDSFSEHDISLFWDKLING